MNLSNSFRFLLLRILRPYLRNPLVDRGKWFLVSRLNPKPGRDHDCIRLGSRAAKTRGGAYILCDLRHASERFTYFTGEYEVGAGRLLSYVLDRRWRFIDVGANVGQYMVTAASLAGEVISFEPNPISRWFLRSNEAINEFDNVVIHPWALGEQDGEMMLSQVGDNIGGASLIRNGEEGFAIPVPVRRGDSLFDGNRPTYLKIDVEGFELQVLRGFSGLLGRKQTIVQVEITDTWLQIGGESAARLFDYMKSHGYFPFLIGTRSKLRTSFVLSKLEAPLKEFQYDVLFVPAASLNEFLKSVEHSQHP